MVAFFMDGVFWGWKWKADKEIGQIGSKQTTAGIQHACCGNGKSDHYKSRAHVGNVVNPRVMAIKKPSRIHGQNMAARKFSWTKPGEVCIYPTCD